MHESPFRHALAGLVAVALALCCAGCASEVFDPAEAPEYITISQFVPFYRFGPQQPSGPDVSLRSGVRFKLLRREMGYSYVQLDDGRSGYVANDLMAPAPPRPPEPAATPASTRSSTSSARRSGTDSPAYTGPALNDTPLPDPNVPPPDLNIDPEVVPDMIPVPAATPTGTPRFRY